MSLKVAIVGVGGMGGLHFGIYKNLDSAELIAACDVDMEMLEKKAEGMDIRLYSDFDEMLKNETPDIVDVATPTYLHKEMAIKALKSGANVICEKPMALSVEDANEVIKTTKECGKTFMTAHVVRFMKAYRYLENVVRTQKHGKLVKLDMRRVSGTPDWSYENWMLDENRSGGVALDLAIHDIDYMQTLFGEPQNISGVNYTMKNNTAYISACYNYGDFSVSVQGGWFNADIEFSAEFCAIFENGYVELKDGKLTENGKEVDLSSENMIKVEGINLSEADGYDAELEYFIECVQSGKSTDRVTPESSLESVSLVKKTLDCLKAI